MSDRIKEIKEEIERLDLLKYNLNNELIKLNYADQIKSLDGIKEWLISKGFIQDKDDEFKFDLRKDNLWFVVELPDYDFRNKFYIEVQCDDICYDYGATLLERNFSSGDEFKEFCEEQLDSWKFSSYRVTFVGKEWTVERFIENIQCYLEDNREDVEYDILSGNEVNLNK